MIAAADCECILTLSTNDLCEERTESNTLSPLVGSNACGLGV